jgi:hypothetical protein
MNSTRFIVAPIAILLLAACHSNNGNAGSGGTSADRDADAHACLAEIEKDYDGKTYEELFKKRDFQDTRRMRKHEHSYDVSAAVSLDMEHKPDGLQVDFDVVDGDEPPSMTPLTKTLYLRKGEVLKIPRQP